MVQSNEEKVIKAIAYLRSRNKYILDRCKWTPTSAEKTDVRATIAAYRKAKVVK